MKQSLNTSLTSEYPFMQATPLFKDRRNFQLMADPLLKGNYPSKGLHQALAVAAMCLQDDAAARPAMSDVVTALEYLTNGGGPEGEEEDDDEEEEDEEKKKSS